MARNLDIAFMEATRGFELTTQLGYLLPCLQLDEKQLKLAGDLFNDVLRSLSLAISFLKPSNCVRSGEVSNSSIDFGENIKQKGRKGSVPLETKITCAPHEDGYLWRKYGQKKILKSMFSREYYRCNGSKDCPARKHVQQDDNNYNKFHVTYFERHTCNFCPQPVLNLNFPPNVDRLFRNTIDSNSNKFRRENDKKWRIPFSSSFYESFSISDHRGPSDPANSKSCTSEIKQVISTSKSVQSQMRGCDSSGHPAPSGSAALETTQLIEELMADPRDVKEMIPDYGCLSSSSICQNMENNESELFDFDLCGILSDPEDLHRYFGL